MTTQWHRMLAVLIALLPATGCGFLGKEIDPDWCLSHPTDPECDSSVIAGCAQSGCSDPSQPFCDMPSDACVVCLSDGNQGCGGTTPVCAENACRACIVDDECSDSGVCEFAAGSCATASSVLYAAPTGTGDCSRAAPCDLITAIARTDDARSIVKLAPGDYATPVSIMKKKLTLYGEGASLSVRGDAFTVLGSADVTVFGLRIHGGTNDDGGNGRAFRCDSAAMRLLGVTAEVGQDVGVFAKGCVLVIERSTIARNRGGGISFEGAREQDFFDITNTLIVYNGDVADVVVGGVKLTFAPNLSNRFQFNTIVDNVGNANASIVGGVACDIAFEAANNIIARNFFGRDATAPRAQAFGACSYPTSKIQNDLAGLSFQRPDLEPYDYTLQSNSTAIDGATTPSSIEVDHDGRHRPAGAQKDIGAFEFPK